MTRQAISPALAEAIDSLILSALRQGRDFKLVIALLDALTSMLLQEYDAMFPSKYRTDSAATARTAAKLSPGKQGMRSRVPSQVKARLAAVVDSLSDDEAARYLGIGVRQVRRRRSNGDLYSFEVGRKRRYPIWQFTSGCTVLPGLREVVAVIPRELPPEFVLRLMTTTRARLNIEGRRSDPVSWLLNGGDRQPVVRLLKTLVNAHAKCRRVPSK